MKKWPNLRDIFSFRPTNEWQRTSLGLEQATGLDDTTSFTSAAADQEARWQKIKFDNTIRVWIAVPSYLACYVLWFEKAIASLLPMTIVFTTYGAVQFLINWIFMGSRFGKKFDLVFSSLDLIAMSFSIYYTGGTNSPLYFLYFIPLVVHAFHRDWTLVLFNGFGGVVLYAVAICNSLPVATPALITNLGARLFFMLLTVSVACMAINVLRKKDDMDRRKLRRLKNLTLVSEKLNHVVSPNDLPQTATTLISLINDGLGEAVQPWTRFLFVQRDESLLRALADTKDCRLDLKQEIPTLSCPVMKNNNRFILEDARNGTECPTERFSFGSHACIPVSGTENESFGVLFVGSPHARAFKEEELQFLEFVGRSLGLAIQRLNRMEELRKSVEMNSCVMAATIASARSADEAFAAVLDGIATILNVEKASLMLWNFEKGALQTVSVKGPGALEERTLVLRMGEGIPGKTIEKAEPFWTSNVTGSLFDQEKTFGIKSFLCLPLKTIKGENLGVINAARTESNEGFSAIELEVAATFATRASLAIENALMHRDERDRIQSLSKPSDIKRAA